jgi:hypothetical protein
MPLVFCVKDDIRWRKSYSYTDTSNMLRGGYGSGNGTAVAAASMGRYRPHPYGINETSDQYQHQPNGVEDNYMNTRTLTRSDTSTSRYVNPV